MQKKGIKIPSHVAIIMDGNRRWASARLMPAAYGHKKGVETVKKIVKAAKKINIKHLTLYAFSNENWNRSKLEIKALMLLLEKALNDYSKELDENDISLNFIGRISGLPEKLVSLLEKTQKKLKDNKSMILTIALNYGGRQEIADAVNAAIKKGAKNITEDLISENLYAPFIKDPDLVIRTSNELRISNFLLWQSAYSEFYFSEKLWPDFGEEDFYKAIEDYSLRERRLGA